MIDLNRQDFDGGEVGSSVVQQLTATPNKYVMWTVQPASRFPNGNVQVAAAVLDQQTWVAVTSKFEPQLPFINNDLIENFVH